MKGEETGLQMCPEGLGWRFGSGHHQVTEPVGSDQITGEGVGQKRAWVSPQGTPAFRMDIGRVASCLESQSQEGESSRAVSMIL